MDALEGESGELAPVLVEPRFVTSLVFFFVLLGLFWKVRRMKFALRRRQKRNLLVRGHQQHPQRTRIWIVRAIVCVVKALWCWIKALCRLPQLLLRVLAAVAAAINISSAPQLQSQHLAIGDEFAAAILRPLLQIWNEDSLVQGSANIMASFDEINQPIRCDSGKSPNSSNCSTPIHYEYRYGVVSGSGENNEQHLQFKPYSLLEHGDVRLINSTSLSQIDKVCQCKIVQFRYQQMLYKAIADNSDQLDSCLSKSFNSAGLCMDANACMDASHFTCQSAKRCVKILKTTARLLCAMWKELAETDCQSFHQDLKDHYFALCARRPIENIFEVAHSVSSMTWSGSNLYQMLVLYEVIFDVLPAVQKLRLGCPHESARIFQQMIVNFKGVFNELKCSIHDNLNRSQNGMMHVSHPGTKSLIHYMKLFKNHRTVIQQISWFCDGSFSLGNFLSEVISYWAGEIEEHSKLYSEGRNYIFLLNNLTYYDEETADLREVLLHDSNYDEVVSLLDSQSLKSRYKSRYLETCWRPALDCLELNVGTNLSLAAFTLKFDDVYYSQRTLVLHTQLKSDLRQEIQDFIIPAYGTFLRELQKKRARRLFCRCGGTAGWHRTVEEMKTAVGELFESEHIH